MEEDIEKRKNSIKKKLSSWITDNYDKLFIGILLASFVINLLIFIKTAHQPLWWDEGDYFSTARRWGLGLDIRDMWYYRRGFLWPLIGAAFFKLGLGELGMRFLVVLFSTGITAVSYFLVKEMFDKKKAILVSLLVALSWVLFFFTGRLLTDIPSTFLLLLSLFFFWKGYVLKKGNKFIYLFGLFFALAVLTRMQILMFAPAFLAIIFIREKFKFVKNKQLWITLGIFLIFFIPQIILYSLHYGNPITDILGRYFGVQGTSSYLSKTTVTLFDYFKNLPYILGGQYLIGQIIFYLFLIGVIIFFFDLILGFDKIFKNEEIQKKFFIFLWVVVPFLALGYITLYVEQRYALPCIVFLFLIATYPLFKLEDYLKKVTKLSKKFIFFLIILIVIGLSISSMIYGNHLTDSKITSYSEIQQAGAWIKENSNPKDVIISQSYPQITYYAERSTYSPNYKLTDAKGLGELIDEFKPKYYMLSAIERSEDWTYTYPQNNSNLVPVWVYPQDSQQPTVIIYEFKYS